VYRWDGSSMTRVLDGAGLPNTPQSSVSSLTQQPDTPFTITTVDVGTTEVEPGWCENTVYKYQWGGNTFIQTEKVPVRVKCGG
jgi:hypothetical protein